MQRFRFLAACLFLCNLSCIAANPGYWAMYFGQVRFSNQWSLHLEAQWRNAEIRPNLEQTILRVGANYHASSSVMLTAGYAAVSGYRNELGIFKNAQSFENRAWQQVLLRQTISRVQLEHRYRLEERWISTASNLSYRTRMRYLLRATVPLNHASLTKNTLFCSFFDEVFLNFKTTPFDRNRFYSAIGFQFTPASSIQAGAMWQSTANATKAYGQLMWIYNFDLRKPKN